MGRGRGGNNGLTIAAARFSTPPCVPLPTKRLEAGNCFKKSDLGNSDDSCELIEVADTGVAEGEGVPVADAMSRSPPPPPPVPSVRGEETAFDAELIWGPLPPPPPSDDEGL